MKIELVKIYIFYFVIILLGPNFKTWLTFYASSQYFTRSVTNTTFPKKVLPRFYSLGHLVTMVTIPKSPYGPTMTIL